MVRLEASFQDARRVFLLLEPVLNDGLSTPLPVHSASSHEKV